MDSAVINLVREFINRRNDLHLTQQELADLCGMQQSAVARVENLSATPQLLTLCKLARGLNAELKLVPKTDRKLK